MVDADDADGGLGSLDRDRGLLEGCGDIVNGDWTLVSDDTFMR